MRKRVIPANESISAWHGAHCPEALQCWFGSCTMLSATHAEEASSRYLYCKPLPCRHRDGRSRRWLFFSERWPWLNRRATRASSSMRVQRAGATISSVVSIHVSMVSHPDVVATLIARAAAQEKRFLYLP